MAESFCFVNISLPPSIIFTYEPAEGKCGDAADAG